MNKNGDTVLPQLRFRQYKDYPAWNIDKFGNLIVAIDERAGTKEYTLMSVTSGVGLVSQIEKFGREIAGNAYKNYYVIKKGDFAYNKSATKQFPEGYISMLTEYDEAALPNSIFTCFRIIDEECDLRFFDHLFQNNYHGSWLRKYIEVGARAHGSLSVDSQHLWDMPVALPSYKEQQKIADCLSSLDDLISAEDKKLAALKLHKKGLMQKLFPDEGKNFPEWRFPQFRNGDGWDKTSFKQVFTKLQYGLNAAAKEYDGKNKYIRITDIDESSRRYISEKAVSPDCELDDTYLVRERDILFARTGASTGKTYIYSTDDGVLYFAGFLIRGNVNEKYCPQFIFAQTLSANYEKWVAFTSTRSGQPGINANEYESFVFSCPSLPEQQKIANCFSRVDELITAQTEKIGSLKAHKIGLIQGLFPSIEEVEV